MRIAYSVTGEGPPLLLCPILVESFSFDDTVPAVKEFVNRLGEGRTLVRYDIRGTGLSDRNPDDVSVDAQARDLHAVVVTAGFDKITILAPTIAGPRGIRFAVQHPDLVQSLIFYGTAARGEDAMPRNVLEALTLMARSDWQLGSYSISDIAGRTEFPDAQMQYAEWYMMSTDGETAARIVQACYDADVTQDLSRVACPTLVLHRPKDPAIAFQAGQRIAAGIPGARIAPLPGAGHNIALGESDAVLKAIDGFLDKIAPREQSRASTVGGISGKIVRTVLFTDLVGHTEMMSRLGDAGGREVLREHERITREILVEHGGTEVKTMGDGFLASFGSVTKAVDCAVALQRAMDERNESAGEPLRVRVGLNAGEPIEEEGDLFGATVILASRIAAKAEGGEILVADTVRGLCSGKGFLFADRGEFVAKGFEEPVRLFEVRWEE